MLIKSRSRQDSEAATSSLDDFISLDESISIDNLTLSPTHYIEKATSAAKHYLPTSTGDAVGALGSTIGHVATKASKKVADAQSMASDTVIRTRERASSFLETIKRTGNNKEQENRPPTPQFVANAEQFLYDDQISFGNRSASTSSEDLRSEIVSIKDQVK